MSYNLLINACIGCPVCPFDCRPVYIGCPVCPVMFYPDRPGPRWGAYSAPQTSLLVGSKTATSP